MLADYLPSWMVKKDPAVAPYQVSTTATQTTDNPYNIFGTRQETAPYGPFTNAPDQSFEFTDIGSYTTPITNAAKNLARMVTKDSLTAGNQAESGRAWWDFTGKAADAASAVGAGIQSTLTKVIILVVVVAVVALFGMSYVQAKGNKLANQ